MSVATLLTNPVTLVYRSVDGVDAYGQPILEESRVEDARAYARLLSTSESDSVSVEQIDLKVYLLPTVSTDHLVAVAIDGVDYQVQGVPHRQYNPRLRRTEYVVVSARRAAS